jgi:hypothetical protein
MKRIVGLFAGVITLLLFGQCSNFLTGNKKLPEPDKVVFTCNNQDYFSDMDFIRAMGTGTSRNESTSHRMADLDATANLARAVDDYLEKVNAYRDNKQMDKGEAAVEWEGETLVREEINMTLSNVATVCSESSQDDAMFTTLVIVEIPMSSVLP